MSNKELTEACQVGNLVQVKRLVEQNIDIHARDDYLIKQNREPRVPYYALRHKLCAFISKSRLENIGFPNSSLRHLFL